MAVYDAQDGERVFADADMALDAAERKRVRLSQTQAYWAHQDALLALQQEQQRQQGSD